MRFANIDKIYFLESRSRCRKMLGVRGIAELEADFAVSYNALHKSLPLSGGVNILAVTFVYGSPIVIDYMCFLSQHGIRTCLLLDGPLEYVNMNANDFYQKSRFKLLQFTPYDAVGCVDASQKEYFKKKGHNAFIYKNKFMNEITLDEVSFKSVERVLITTAKKPYFNVAEKNNLVTLILDIHNKFRSKKTQIEFRIFDSELIDQISTKLNDDFKNSVDDSLEEQIMRNDTIVTTPSSIVLDASVHKKRVVTLDYRWSPILYKCSWRYSLSVDFDGMFSSLEENELLSFQRNPVDESELNVLTSSEEFMDYRNFSSLRYVYRFVYPFEKIYRRLIDVVFYGLGFNGSWIIGVRNYITRKVKF